MLYWVNVRIGVEANNVEEARVKVGRTLLGEANEDVNFLVGEIDRDKKYRTLEDLRFAQKERSK